MDRSILISVKDLSVSTTLTNTKLVNSISFNIFENEILGMVGESGSGKSLTALSLMGLLPVKTLNITQGTIHFENNNLVIISASKFQSIRGNQISMIFQTPMSALNPSVKCGIQVEELISNHNYLKKDLKNYVLSLFNDVKLPNPQRIYNSYPHELSGGQKQRVMIAMAIACKPKLLIADEPTTALDVTVQKEIIKLLKQLQQKHSMSVLFITHDLALISEIANRVVVIYKGKIVEQGLTHAVFNNPKELYTKALLYSRPNSNKRLKILPTVSNFLNANFKEIVVTSKEREQHQKKIYSKAPLLEVKNLEKTYFGKSGWFKKTTNFKALHNVSFNIYEGETVGLVGESGCGKSTLSNAILQLDKATSGSIFYKGRDITKLNKTDTRKLRKDIQLIFQDPYLSLNPRLTVGEAIIEPIKVHGIYKAKNNQKQAALKLLIDVGLEVSYFNRYPHELSGGQRQRINIARAIALQPKLIICDESVSALDISVQAQVLNLLNNLKEKFKFTYIFISHDLNIVKYMSNQLLVMHNGKIVEQGDADVVYNHPKNNYTKTLINAIPKGI